MSCEWLKKKIYYIILKSLPNCEGAEEKARLSGVLKTEEQRWVGGLFCTLNGCTQHRMPIKPEASKDQEAQNVLQSRTVQVSVFTSKTRFPFYILI